MENTINTKAYPLFHGPFQEAQVELPEEFLAHLLKNDLQSLDIAYQNSLKPKAFLWSFLENFCKFKSLEGIVAVREAPQDDQGIWHDDGSRALAFSLSLNLEPKSIEGGELLLRPRFQFKDNEDTGATVFTVRPYGTILLFKTGLDGFEHRVTQVTKGKRIVLAGWCS